MSQVKFSSYTLCLDSRHILESADPDEDHVVLLQVVTLSGDVGGQLPTIGKPHYHALKLSCDRQPPTLRSPHLSIGTVRLLRLLYNGFYNDTFGKRGVEAKRVFVGSELLVGSLPVSVCNLKT